MTLKFQIDEALKQHRGDVEKVVLDQERLDRYTSGDNSEGGQVTRLRLDFELSDEALDDMSDESGVETLISNITMLDLEDLLENGDVESDDPLYKAMDGFKKLGRDFEVVQLLETVMYREYKKGKKSTEFTWYMLLFTK